MSSDTTENEAVTDVAVVVRKFRQTEEEFKGVLDFIEQTETPMQTKPDQDRWWHPTIRVGTITTREFLRWLLEGRHNSLFDVLNDVNSELPPKARENISSQLRNTLSITQRLADSEPPHDLVFTTPMELNTTIDAAMYSKRLIQVDRDNVPDAQEKVERIDTVLKTLEESHWDEDVLEHFRQIPYAEGLDSN